ncbi:MAG: hypothetical protein NT031_06765 [Planctomycetota bacterium]|nr:hypothetical protein [Planctomycetota bacterium]
MTTSRPFDDAVAMWHMASSDGLTIHGDAEMGVALDGADREASLARGGDGRAAKLTGGWISVDDDALKLTGPAMTLCLRVKDTAASWNAPLLAKDDPNDPYGTILSASQGQLRYLWRTTPAAERTTALQFDNSTSDYLNGVMRLNAPTGVIGPDGWHDVVIRFRSPNLELFVDGVLIDEEWPHGELHEFQGPFLIGAAWQNGQKLAGFHGLIDHVALWNRALSDGEIVAVSGGAAAVARRDLEILGPHRPGPQYWRPRGHNTCAGDCMLFSHGGRLHLFWLFDRHHHASKWGRGAHEWAHWSSADLVHWEQHPRAIKITEAWECAAGTGSLIEYQGKVYAYYAEFAAWGNYKDSPYKELAICLAESDDGIHFRKLGKIPPRGFDSHTFLDPATGLYHLLTPGSGQVSPTNWPDGKNGTLDYTTTDPVHGPWTLQPKHFHEAFGCCPHVFLWNGWYYLIIESRVWLSRSLSGPWTENTPTRLCPLHVPGGAVFNNRAFFSGWLGEGPEGSWGGNIVVHELIQNPDGMLGMKFVPEMIPPCGEPVALAPAGAALAGLPRDARLRLELKPLAPARPFSLRLRATDAPASGLAIRFDPGARTGAFGLPEGAPVKAAPFTELDAVDALDRPVTLDMILVGDIVDVCINGRRTLTTRCKGLTGDRLVFENCTTAANVDARPLKGV